MSEPKQTGNNIEQYVIRLLEDNGYTVSFIDAIHDLDVIDSKTGFKYFCEVKSCSRYIIDRCSNAGYRTGRFNIPITQHDYMCSIDGHYIFVVYDNDVVMSVQIIRALDLQLNKLQELIRWKELYNSVNVCSDIILSKFQQYLMVNKHD